MNFFSRRSYFFIFCTLISFPVFSAIQVDGVLDEQEWRTAKQITQFYEVGPFTLNEPEQGTKVLIKETEEGIFLGYINSQPESSMRSQQHARDQDNPNADKVGVTIDYDGDALMAYSFAVSLGGSLWDGVYRNGNDRSKDWDGDWKAQTSISKEAWYAEFFIPWTVAPMKKVEGEKRTVRISFWRISMEISKAYASIKSSPGRSMFLYELNDLELGNFSSSKVDFFPYLTLSDEKTLGKTDTKFGAEVFWKIDSGSQINAAFNPDFGQVESDDIVINFSAMETYYADKRPFFSENQSMFDVDGYNFLYVVNTRRIGGAPDYSCSKLSADSQELCNSRQEGSTDIDVALRYTKVGNDYDVGLLVASEDDEEFSVGRDFLSARYRFKMNNLSFGYLGTLTKNSVLNYNANVNTLDVNYRNSSGFKLYGLLLNSIVDDVSGLGLRLSLSKVFSKSLSTGAGFWYMDDDLKINDMGYLARNDWILLGGRTSYQKTDFSSESNALSRSYTLNYGCRSNTHGDAEGCYGGFSIGNQFKDSSGNWGEVFFRTESNDNMITRKFVGSPFVRMPKNYGLKLRYESPKIDTWQWSFFGERSKGGENSAGISWRNKYNASIKFLPTDNSSIRLSFTDESEDNWLNWIKENSLGIYEKKQRRTNFSVKWFKGNKHELRIKAQLVAFNAKNPNAVIANSDGRLKDSDTVLDPFSVGQLAFQVRYRYEIMPLAYLYAVYTKGGLVYEENEEDSLKALYKRPWNHPSKDNFTLKIRYRF
jgi:hypothetical protein